MSIPALQTAAVGAPITRLDVSLIPIYLMANTLPEINSGSESGIQIKELETAAVSVLLAENPTDVPILLLEGEHLLGGKQNRLVNASVLVPPDSKLEIPVSCLERGRWSRARAYRANSAAAPPRVRRRAQEGVLASIRRDGSRRGNQGAVWEEVDSLLGSVQVRSSTAAAADAEQRSHQDKGRAKILDQLIEGGTLPGQCGIAVAQGRDISAIELFGAPSLLKNHWGMLVRSYMFPGSKGQGVPSATRVLYSLKRFSNSVSQDTEGVGLGTEHRLNTKGWIGQALSLEGSLVHGSFFYQA